MEDAIKLSVGTDIEVVHRAFDHAVHALKITSEFHTDGDVLIMISQRMGHCLFYPTAFKVAHKNSISL